MTMRMKLSLSCLMALGMALGVAQAQPQPQPQPSASQPNALQGFSQNRNQPVQINAQTLEVRDKSKVATYSGNVRLVQGDTTLRCKVLVIYYDGGQVAGQSVKAATPGPAGNSQIRRIEATGNVIVSQKDQTATGEKAIYDISDDTVRLFPAAGSNVTVTQGPNIVSGQRLIVHLDTGISHFESDGHGPGVVSLIVPNSMKNDNHAAPAAPATTHQATPHAAPKPRNGPSDSNNLSGLH
jgi:lipopolysaccharide export system protein LptA